MINYIGKSEYGELVFQSLNEQGVIRGFDLFDVMELIDGEVVLSQSSWLHKVELENGCVYTSGMPAVTTIDMPDDLRQARKCDTVSCEECGAVHDSDDSVGNCSSPTWTIVNECEAVCLGCRQERKGII